MRIIQVGLGPWGLDWARKIVPSVDGVEVVARADADAAARAGAARTLGESETRYHRSLTEALAAVDADAVLVTVPMAGHAPVVGEALAAGKHVLVEKPFTETVAEARELVDLADARNRVLMVSQNYRHFPAPLAAADIVADGRFGAVRAADIAFRYDAADIEYRYHQLAQPLLSDMSIHHFDLMRMILGAEPVAVTCRTSNPDGSPFVGPPVAEATLDFADGLAVTYSGSWVSKESPTAWAGEWHMVFDEAEIWWTSRGSDGERTARDRLMIRRDGVDHPSPELEPPPHLDRAGCLAAFRDVVETGSPPPHFSSGRDNVNSLAMVEAAVLSSQSGRPVALAGLPA